LTTVCALGEDVAQGFAAVLVCPALQSGMTWVADGVDVGVWVAGAAVEIVVEPMLLDDDPPPPHPAAAHTSSATTTSSPMRRCDLTTRGAQ
jgi:hypothetical protein